MLMSAANIDHGIDGRTAPNRSGRCRGRCYHGDTEFSVLEMT